MDKVRFGVVGIKGVGRNHIAAAKEAASCELAAIAEIDEEAAKKTAEEHGVRYFLDFHEMLKMDEVDAVALATPHPLHKEMAISAMEAGKDVLVEKPLSVTVSEADEMVKASQETKRKLGVVFQYRTITRNKTIKKLIPELGEIYRTISVSTGMRAMSYYRSAPWRGTWKSEGGGVLINQAPHQLDIFQWFVGMPKRVLGWTRTLRHDISVEDLASALFEYENGAVGYLHANVIDAPGRSLVEVCGNKGSLISDNLGLRIARPEPTLDEYIRDATGKFGRPEGKWEEVEFEHGGGKHLTVFEDFARAVIEDKEPPVSGTEGRKSVELMNAIILSSKRKKSVELPVDREEYDRLLAELREEEADRAFGGQAPGPYGR